MFEFLTQMIGGQGAAAGTAGAGAGAGAEAGGGGIMGLFADPNFQSFLAGTGANLDPNGAGAAIGKPTQAMIQNQQMGKAMEKQDKRWQSLIEAMAGGKVAKATLKEDGKGGSTITLGASDGGLGTLDKPVQATSQPAIEASPFSQYMNNMQSWFQKFGGM